MPLEQELHRDEICPTGLYFPNHNVLLRLPLVLHLCQVTGDIENPKSRF